MPQHRKRYGLFVRNTPQLCTGRGEVMTPVKLDLRGLWIAVVKPDCGVSTREAYAGIRPGVPAVPLAERIARPVTEWQTFLKNDFEPHIFAAHPRLPQPKPRFWMPEPFMPPCRVPDRPFSGFSMMKKRRGAEASRLLSFPYNK